MKIPRSRWKKVIISIVLLILFGIIALFIFRNTITKSLLTSFASKQNINLSIDKIDLSFTSGICIINPKIEFQQTYLDATKSMELKALSFDTINVHGFSFSSLIFRGTYAADSLVFNKPDIEIQGLLAQKPEKSKAEGFNPIHLLAILGQEPNTTIKQKVKIGEIRIDYGMANISPVKDSGNVANVVDFDISIKDFSTLAEDLKKPGRILFSDDIQFEVKNINKVMISGYDIDLGELFFSVKKNRLKITDVDLFPTSLSDSVNQIALAAKLIEFNGLSLNELRGKEEILLSSAHISDGYFVTNTNHRKTNGREVHNDVFQKFAKDIMAFKLDTLGIHNFDLRFLEYLKDTISFVQDFNIELYGFALDSSMLDDIYREVAFEEFIMSSGTGAYKIESDGIIISLDSSKYTSVSEVADFYQLKISDSKSPNDLDVSAGKISIAGLAQEVVPYPNKLQLIFTIEDVQAKLNLGHAMFQKKSKGGPSPIFDLVNIKRVELLNANIDLSNDNKFGLQLSGIDVTVNNPLLVTKDKISPNISELNLSSNSMAFSSGNMIGVSSGPIHYGKNDFSISQLSLRYRKASATSSLKVSGLSLKGFLVEELIENKTLSINEIVFGSSKLSGDFDFAAHQVKEQGTKNAPIELPFESISIGQINLKDLQINNKLLLAGEEIAIKSKIDIELEKLDLNGPELNIDELAEIKGKLSISASSPDLFGHSLSLGDLTLDLSNENLDIKDINIKYFGEEGKYKNVINDLQLSILEFDRLNYVMLLQEERFQFHKFKLSDLTLDMVLHPKETEKQKGVKKEFNINDYVRLDTTQLVLENIDLKIEIKGDSSGPVISLHDLDLNYAQSEEVEDNFMSGIDFSFQDFGFNDHIKHSYFTIKSGNFNSSDFTLKLNKISGGNLKNVGSEEGNTKGWSYASSELMAKNIFIRNTLPSKISMDKLAIQGSKLVISSKKQKEKKGSLKLDLESFYEFGNFMTKFSIDTTVFSEIKVHYKSFDDSTSHVYVADSIGLTLHNINLDSTSIEEKDFGIIKQMNIDFKGRTSITKDSLYEISSGLLSYNFKDEIISIDSFRLTPRYEGDEFYKRAVYQTDRMDIFGQHIKLQGFRLEELLKNDLIHFGWIDIDSLNLEMVRDKRYPLKGDYKAMPQQMLASLSQKILIDSVSVRDSYMKYGEYDKKSVLPGTVFFDRFNLNIQNITNLHPLPENNNSIKLNLNAYLMGKARLDLDMGISYIGSDSNFWFSATTEQLDLTTLNPLTENLLGITIRSGSGRVQESSVTANSVSSKGSMIFTYKKMKLGLYNRSKDHENKGMFAGITRFLINDLIVASNNPKFARKPKTGEIYFKRDVQKSFINFTWKSLLSGIMSTAGFNNKEQRQEKKEAKKQEKVE